MGFRGRLGYAGYIITDNFLHPDKEYENTKNDYLYSEERLISEKVLNVLTNIQHFMYTVKLTIMFGGNSISVGV